MRPPRKLPPEVLRRRSDPALLPFDSTAQVASLVEIVGQDRAVDAIQFGAAIRREGYNMFALGPHGTGKQTILRQYLGRQASALLPPGDWCYVHNFLAPNRPRALRLPPGAGSRLQKDMAQLVADLRSAIPTAFEGEDYRTRKQQLTRRFKDRHDAGLARVQEGANERGVAVVRTDTGVLIAPLKDSQILEPEQFHELPEDERSRIQAAMDATREELTAVFRQAHDSEREQRDEQKVLDREFAAGIARQHVDVLRERYRELANVQQYLDAVESDVADHADDFLQAAEAGVESALRRAFQRGGPDGPSFRRYAVNLFVDNSGRDGAPVIYEDNPSYSNLIGRVEHVAEFGALVTDFTLIKAGALHRASGGFLLLEAVKVLQQPFAWEALKRALRGSETRIESVGQLLGVTATASLEPEPIPLDSCKVVLFGERVLYYLLAALDPDFLELFKVIVDFEETMERSPDTQAIYARLIATLAQKDGLRAFDRGAVALVLDQAARLAGDAEKLSVRMRPVVDLLREADFWAERAGHPVAAATDVQRAIDSQERRAGRMRDRLLEEIRRGTLLISTRGERAGQINGLSVVRLGENDFGFPTRITARVRLGRGEVVDIEREVELGGPLHSKGVLILSGFLGARYARKAPLSLSASLVFEQSYGGVEGDSASLAELCALLSALAEVPIRQCFAVTGSVNQHGDVQAIGGVNEKIEGFFDVCQGEGLTGEQAVLIPASNEKHLMLRQDVVAACVEGRFNVFCVESVDEAMALLTGRSAEELNERIVSRLAAFAEEARAFLDRTPKP